MSIEVTKYQQDARFPQTASEDEIDLRELFSVIWQGKYLIIAITAIFAIGSVIFAIKQPNIYKSEALLAPADAEQGGGGLAALAGQFGGLASMAGINLGGGGGADKTQLAIEVMKSRQFFSNFTIEHDILPDLMAVKSWDIVTKNLVYDPEIYDANNKVWTRKVSPPLEPEPSMQESYKEFSRIFSVKKTKETGMVIVSIEHVSPSVAQQWVAWLVQDINKVMKERDVLEAMRSTVFLKKQIALTNVADVRSMLYKMIEEQAKIIMFSEVRDEYIFETVDPSIIPEEKHKPQRALICLLGTFFGIMLSMMLLLINAFFKRSNTN
jgi:uncharacterized protein involved in exopolysaccharide biosynthesis